LFSPYRFSGGFDGAPEFESEPELELVKLKS